MRVLRIILATGALASLAMVIAVATLLSSIFTSYVEQQEAGGPIIFLFTNRFDVFGADHTGPLGALVGTAAAIPVATLVILALLWPRVPREAPELVSDR